MTAQVQLAFKGQWPDGRVLWDNNGNRNWATGVELTSEEGLVTYNAAAQSQVIFVGRVGWVPLSGCKAELRSRACPPAPPKTVVLRV